MMEHRNVKWSDHDGLVRYGFVVGFADVYAAWIREYYIIRGEPIWENKYTRVSVEDLRIIS